MRIPRGLVLAILSVACSSMALAAVQDSTPATPVQPFAVEQPAVSLAGDWREIAAGLRSTDPDAPQKGNKLAACYLVLVCNGSTCQNVLVCS